MVFKIKACIVVYALFFFGGLLAGEKAPYSMEEVDRWHKAYGEKCLDITAKHMQRLHFMILSADGEDIAKMQAGRDKLEDLRAAWNEFNKKHERYDSYIRAQIEQEQKAKRKPAPSKSTEVFAQPKTSREFAEALLRKNLSLVDVRRTSTGDRVYIVKNTINGEVGQLLSDFSVDQRLRVS